MGRFLDETAKALAAYEEDGDDVPADVEKKTA
jgi:hypothetical protein